MSDTFFVHESSYVDDGAVIGTGTRIWHFCHIMPETEIGKNCNIGQNVFIGPRVRIGNTCKIQNNVSVYEGVTRPTSFLPQPVPLPGWARSPCL